MCRKTARPSQTKIDNCGFLAQYCDIDAYKSLVPRAFKMGQAVLKGILSSLISVDFVKADLILAEKNKILIRGFAFYVKFTVHWYRNRCFYEPSEQKTF